MFNYRNQKINGTTRSVVTLKHFFFLSELVNGCVSSSSWLWGQKFEVEQPVQTGQTAQMLGCSGMLLLTKGSGFLYAE